MVEGLKHEGLEGDAQHFTRCGGVVVVVDRLWSSITLCLVGFASGLDCSCNGLAWSLLVVVVGWLHSKWLCV